MQNDIRITTINGDYDVLIGKRWQRGFNSLWAAKLYRSWLRIKMRFRPQRTPSSTDEVKM